MFRSWKSILPYMIVALVWLLTRIYPLAVAMPERYWEVWEARKLLEYGFGERHGAIIDNHFMTGSVEHPERFNYVNHPYPILWAITGMYALGGPNAAMALNTALGLMTCLLVLACLRAWFGPGLALFGALLYTIAPSSITYDVDPNTVACISFYWPAALWILRRVQKDQAEPVNNGSVAAKLGLLALVAGQVSWFSHSLFPALLAPACALTWSRGRGFSFSLRKPVVIGLLAGSLVTGFLFLGQLFVYVPDLGAAMGYLKGQAGTETGLSSGRMFIAIAARSVLSLGPALYLGLLLWFLTLRKRDRIKSIEFGALIYLVVFALAAVALRRFFFRELHMYELLVFPFTVLTVTALQTVKSKWIRAAVGLVAVAAVAYPWLQASIPPFSRTSEVLAARVAEMAKKGDVVVTNLRPQEPPFESWDVASITGLAMRADRLVRSVRNEGELANTVGSFKVDQLPIIYLEADIPGQDPGLVSVFSGTKPQRVEEIPLPEEKTNPAIALRNFYWKLVGKHLVKPAAAQVEKKLTLKEYSVTVRAIDPTHVQVAGSAGK